MVIYASENRGETGNHGPTKKVMGFFFRKIFLGLLPFTFATPPDSPYDTLGCKRVSLVVYVHILH